MEMMPYQPAIEPDVLPEPLPVWASLPTWGPVARPDWRAGLPVLEGAGLTLRELRIADAPSLFAELTTHQVARFISPPPDSVAGFEAFIHWAHRQRAQGQYACFAVVPAGETRAVGIFQIKVREADAGIAEWGFALGSAYWGTGLFLAGAHPVVDFAFAAMGMQRLEARACVANGRGSGALRKVGAVRTAVLPGAFERAGERLDQALWTIARDDWWAAKAVRGGTVH
jgi:RimJ/RimL family protein N-acetyltransferase